VVTARRRPGAARTAGNATPLDEAYPTTPGGFTTGLQLPGTDLAALPFAALAADLPLLLLPVRIETRYRLDADPPELRIRIYPDQLHIDADTPVPGPVETDLARNFWREWHAAAQEPGRQRAWRTLVRRVGPNRAGYLARQTRPRRTAAGLDFPDFPDLPDRPDLPGGTDLPSGSPARPTLLPGQWLAVGYSADGVLFSRESRTVDPDLGTAPDPQAPPWQVPGSGVVTDEALAWMFDYDRAVEAGMAITVPLTGDATPARTEISTLLVVGVDAGRTPAQAAAELERLLGVHARTDGLAFVPQGTPTNNTETAASGWSEADPEPATQPGAAVTTRSASALELDPPPPPPVQGDNAARLATALGLAADTILRRVALGTDTERSRSRAMVRLAFEAVLGTFVRGLLRVGDTDAISSDAMAAIQDWCVQHVTGGAPYATVRIGPQPYGVLPVMRSTVAATPSTTAEHVQAVISLLIDEWRRAAALLPVLDPDRADVAGGGDPNADPDVTEAIATILATQPHPQRLFVRRLDDFASFEGTPDAALTPQGAFVNLVMAGLDPTTNPNLAPPYEDIGQLVGIANLLNPPETIDEQIALWSSVDDSIFDYMLQTYGGQPEIFEYIIDSHRYVDAVLSMLSSYEQRQRPVRWLGLDAYEGVLGQPNTRLVEGILRATPSEWGPDGLIQDRAAAPGQTAADYLADLRNRLADRVDTLPRSGLHLHPEPLLYQLLNRTLDLVPDDPQHVQQALSALDELATRDSEELEWLLRETLGLGTHRLDAWATSLATERLGRLRDSRPAGIQVGAFGWVTGLDPRASARLSEGFVHAPSMAHATTAALLRSGWQAHGTDDPLSPVAVDLSSARVRSASWLLDGVRVGQDLGALLGYQFERALHDLAASELIRPVRQQVLVASHQPDVPPDEPVDGLELLDLYRAGRLVNVTGPLLAALEDVEGAFDAVNDIGLFESVHQLATGNPERAAAMLDVVSTGVQRPPELRAPLTPRAGVPIEHRVLILLDPDAGPPGRGWQAGVRDAVAPALEAWAGSLLPSAADVGFAVQVEPASAVTALRLDALGLSALDALWLAGDDPAAPSAALRTLAAAALPQAAGRPGRIDPADSGGAAIALSDFAVMATELRRAVDALRVADARDLRPGSAPGDPDTDDQAALTAVNALVERFGTVAARLRDAVAAADAAAAIPLVQWLARLGLATGAPPADLEAAARLSADADRRLAALTAAGQDAPDPRTGAERALVALLAGRVPLLGRFPVTPVTGGDVVDLTTALATADDVDDWLDAVGRVRPDVARLTTAGMLSELLSATGGLHAAVGQTPHVAGDRWAATALPTAETGPAGRLSVVAITGPGGPPAPGASACGLVVDRWAERIPRPDQVTGLAFHFDAPGNRPPQSMLLAVPPDGEPWTLDLVLDTLLETLEWATLRAVGPEDLLDYGRAVPTVFVSGDLTTWPRES